MLYLNQRKYSHIPYLHDLDHGGAPPERRNVGTSGCGLCCLCMAVDHLTLHHLELEECVRLSETNGTNRGPGCAMRILGPIVAEQYGMDFRQTASEEEMIAHLQSGGEVIVNVRADENGRGIFTARGHFMLIISTDGREVCILDPNYAPGKFREQEETGILRVSEPFLYCTVETLKAETRNETPYYLLKRK